MSSKVAIPAHIGARAAMPAASFLDAVSALDLDRMLGPVRGLDAAEPDAEALAEREQVSAIAARLLEPDLRPLLEWLLDQTLRRPLFLAGYGPEAMAIAAGREGENRIVWRLLQAIAIGRGEVPPAREGT